MKKILLVLCLFSISILFYSCGGLYAVWLNIQFCLEKEDGSNFSESELSSFKYSSNGEISGSYSAGKFIPSIKNSSITVQHYLGSSMFNSGIKKIEESYKEKMSDLWFKIDDESGRYETYEMKPLDSKKYEFIETSPKPSIKYTIKLKEKL